MGDDDGSISPPRQRLKTRLDEAARTQEPQQQPMSVANLFCIDNENQNKNENENEKDNVTTLAPPQGLGTQQRPPTLPPATSLPSSSSTAPQRQPTATTSDESNTEIYDSDEEYEKAIALFEPFSHLSSEIPHHYHVPVQRNPHPETPPHHQHGSPSHHSPQLGIESSSRENLTDILGEFDKFFGPASVETWWDVSNVQDNSTEAEQPTTTNFLRRSRRSDMGVPPNRMGGTSSVDILLHQELAAALSSPVASAEQGGGTAFASDAASDHSDGDAVSHRDLHSNTDASTGGASD